MLKMTKKLNASFPTSVLSGATVFRKLQSRFFAIFGLLFFTAAFSLTTLAQTTNFENPPFVTGTIHLQNGWSSSGSAPNSPGFDHAVVNNSSLPTAPPVSFGAQSLRMSNAVTGGGFNDFTFSSSIVNEAGEATANNGGLSGGTRQRQFTAQWDFISADPTGAQAGLALTASPDRGDGARMSFVQMLDTPGGININFFDYQRALGNTCASGANFVPTLVATGLSRTVVHTIRIEMDFLPGIANDVVRIYVDGVLSHTGTSWEDYFRDCEPPSTRTVDSILFRQGGAPSPASTGKGFLVDNLTLNSTSQSAITVTPAITPTATDNDYTRINNAVHSIANGGTITLNGTFNWTEANAAASWALGSDGQTGGTFSDDDYTVSAPANLNGVTVTAASLGAATIQGPGDLAAVNLEGVFYFGSGSPNQNWTISNLRIVNFDIAIFFNFNGGDLHVYDGTKLLNNYILVARDLNATVAPADVNQNIGIHYSFGDNILISNNIIELHGDGVSDSANSKFSTEIAMQSNNSSNAFENLQITNNIVRVLNAQSSNPERIRGIWENGEVSNKNITVSNNQFLNMAPGNNPLTNLQEGFRLTSKSSATTTVLYMNNRVEGANIGFNWLPTVVNTALPTKLVSNVIINNGTGVKLNSNHAADLSFNRIVGNSVGVDNATTPGTSVLAENNWWGCNYGPGAGGAGCAGTANGTLGVVDANPWLVLRTSATPNAITTGGTSAISSNLNFNSDNVDTSSLGSVPNGTPANFTATLGTVSPTSNTTVSGVTGTTFTAGAASGTGGVQTKIDGQTVNAPITIAFSCNNVSIPTGATVAANTQFLVPINVTDSTTGRNITSFDFTLTYNPAVITPIGVETAGTLSNGWTITTNNSSGTLVVSGFSNTPTPLSGSGTLVNVRFISSGGIGTTSNLNLSNFTFNEGIPCVNTTNGNVTVISGTVSGQVTYANSPSTTKPVPNTAINAAGSIPKSTTTDANGLYSLSGFGAGAYTITPSKTGQVNGIGNADATAVAQHVVGFVTLNSTQQIAADVTGNGTITSLDASYIAQYAAGFTPPGLTGTWKFIPANRSYPNVQATFSNENYSAILMGEVTGNWDPLMLRPVSEEQDDENTGKEVAGQAGKTAPEQVITVTAPLPKTTSPTADFTVDLSASDTTGEGVFGYEFNLLYDQTKIVPQITPCEGAGTISSGRSIVCNPNTPGLLRVVVFSTTGVPISGAGTLLKLNFNAVGNAGDTSPLTFQNFMFNEGLPQDVTVDGAVQILGPTAASASISGRLTTSFGRGVGNSRVTLTNSRGESRTTLATSLGFYRFNNVESGETYYISVASKRYQFTPQAVSVASDLSEVNLIAEN